MVCLMLACPSISWTTRGLTLAPSMRVVAVCQELSNCGGRGAGGGVVATVSGDLSPKLIKHLSLGSVPY